MSAPQSLIPPPPELPSDQRAEGRVLLRYEDACQDGRVVLQAMPHTIGQVVWRGGLAEHPMAHEARRAGIIPVLTRLVLHVSEERVSLARPLTGRGGFDLAHSRGESGETERLILNIWVDLAGTRGLHFSPPAADAGEVEVGRVYAEHVFTRLFAPPERRKVTRFELEGFPEVPPAEHDFRPPRELLELPPGGRPLEEGFERDPAPVLFGLHHTDANQHVNSLVYPRLFEDAALRRLAVLGRETGGLLARSVEVAYRKPCFAGESMRLHLRAFEESGGPGASGAFGPEGVPLDRAHCFVRIYFRAP